MAVKKNSETTSTLPFKVISVLLSVALMVIDRSRYLELEF